MKIKQLRQMLGLNQIEFAKELGIPQNTLSNYERERREPPIPLLREMASKYRVTTDYLTDSDLIADDRIASALSDERRWAGLTLGELSKETKIPEKDLEDYEAGIEPINFFLLRKLCNYYDKSIYQFYLDHDMYDEEIPEIFGDDVDKYEEFKKARDEDAMQENLRAPYTESYLYQYVPYGVSAGALEEVEAIAELPLVSVPDLMLGRYARNPNIILMPVNGESMNNVIEDGAIIAVLKNSDPSSVTDGDIVVIQNCGEYSVKRFFNDRIHEEYVFRPDSSDPSFRDIVFSYDNCDDLRLIGKVVMYNVTL